MREKRRKPAPPPSPEPPAGPRDQRLRNLLPLLENLPEELRDALVSILEAAVRTNHLLEAYQRGTKDRQE